LGSRYGGGHRNARPRLYHVLCKFLMQRRITFLKLCLTIRSKSDNMIQRLSRMSSAVHNLQKTIVGGKEPLTQLLRQTKLIAAKLNLEDVQKWVDFELNGYPKGTEPPEYRK
jgi:AbiTii